MSILKAMQARRNLSPVLTIPFPQDKPELELEVQRIPAAMARRAMNKAFCVAEQGGMVAAGLERAEAMLELLERHTVGWQILKGEGPEFTEENKKEFFAALNTNLAVELVAAYDAAALTDFEISGKALSPDSARPSRNGSKSGRKKTA